MKEKELEVINDCINKAIDIINNTYDEEVKELAAYIADKLISITDVQDL